jgi:hypothetical protein
VKTLLTESSANTGSAIFGWGLLSICISLTLGFAARENFLTQFRELATKRFDSVPEPQPANAARPKVSKPKTTARAALRSTIAEVFRRRPVVSSVVGIIVALIVAMLVRSEYWSFRLKREVAAISAAGFPITLGQASRYSPGPSRAEDGFAMLRDSGMPAGPVTIGRSRLNGAPQDPQAVRLKKAEAMLAANQGILRPFWRLSRYARAHIDPFAADLWQEQHRHMTYPLVAQADLIVIATNPGSAPIDRAELSIRSLLAHARLLRQQPLSFAQHSAAQSLELLASALEDVLKADLLDEKMLRALLEETKNVDDPGALTRTLIVQRAQFLDPPPNPFAMAGGPQPPTHVRLAVALSSLSDNLGGREKTTVGILEDFEAAIRLSKTPHPRRFEPTIYPRERRNLFQRTLNPVAGVLMPPGYIFDLFWADCAFIANLHLIQAGLAVECYQRRHTKLPADLGALVPEFLPAVPIDPYNGKQLGMVRTSEGLLIYSVGSDLQDDTASAATRTVRTGADILFTFR